MKIELEIPERVLHDLLDAVPIPPLARVCQDAWTPAPIEDISREVAGQMRMAGVAQCFRTGERIALAVGSRGIGCLPEIVRSVVQELRGYGVEPFIVPSMGSHGGATAEGQREVLAHLGVTPERVGAPVESSIDTVVIGQMEDGAAVYMDQLAAEADGIVIVNRIKPHTALRGPYESGLAKMIAVGLGKQAGAAATHARGYEEMARRLPRMAAIALANGPIRLGLGVLENAHDLPFKIVAIPSNRILAEAALLEEARSAMPRIPFGQFDVLLIDRIGKNVSGEGADPNITGRYSEPDARGDAQRAKQVVLDITDESAGNANGVGNADFTAARLARRMDLGATYRNALTSTSTRPVALPMVLPSDRLALAAALLTCNAVHRDPRLIRIRDTLHLGELWVSPALLEEVATNPELRLASPPEPLSFDAEGNLL